jgi:DNA-3-methyladenine glycosylase
MVHELGAAMGGPLTAPQFGPHLPRTFFDRDSRVAAADLLGRIVVSSLGGTQVAVRLTEVEAYLGEGEDPGSHSHRGLRPRNAVMFGPPGHLYVYFTYGMHWCANLVCRPEGHSSAVLLRAGEIVDGVLAARSRRRAARSDADLARGPARLASALAIDGSVNGIDVCVGEGKGRIWVCAGSPPPESLIRTGPRVGVSGAGAVAPWRYWLEGDPTVSVYRQAKPRHRRAQSTQARTPAP